MDIEGRSRDNTVLTALTHTHVVPYQRDRLKCYHFNPHSFYAGPSGAVPATVTAWISALCWLQQCLFGSRSIAFEPLSTKLVSVTLTATKGRKACGTLSSLSTPVILVSRPITGATTRPNRQCHNFTWSHFGGEPHSFSPTLADGVLQQPTFSLALPACLSTILEMLAPFVSAMVEAAR